MKKKQEKKCMCKILPAGICPNCGGFQFLVYESDVNLFVTGPDGVPVDGKNYSYRADGKCLTCDAEYEMVSTNERFLPLTPLRKILYDYVAIDADQVADHMPNPMEANND